MSKKSYAEFQEEVAKIEKKIASIPDDCPEGAHYLVDKETKTAYYDPQNNMDGGWDYEITQTLANMHKIACAEKIPVVALFNGAPVVMDGNASIRTYEQDVEKARVGMMAWRKDSSAAYKETEEYKLKQQKEALRRAQERKQAERDAEILKSVKLELSNVAEFEQAIERNRDSYGKGIIGFATDWAKLMQDEIAKSSDHILTESIVKDTGRRADLNYGMSGASYSFARNLLIRTWKHGEALGIIEGFSKEEIAEARGNNQSTTSNNRHNSRTDEGR